MYRARDQVDQAEWLDELDRAAEELDLGREARSAAVDLFLSATPESDRSKPAWIAAALYAGALISSEGRTQTEVADAVDVSRLVIQERWKSLLESAGFEPPTW